jgi:hypothetical protein
MAGDTMRETHTLSTGVIRDRRLVWLTFGLCLALYLLTHSGRIMHGDDETMYRVTRNFIETRSLAISQETVTVGAQSYPGLLPSSPYDFETTFASPGRDHAGYSKYGLGQSLAAIPLYMLGKGVARLAPSVGEQVCVKLSVSLLNPLLTALSCAIIVSLSRELGHSRPVALFLALGYGFATMAWAYAKSFYSEPAVTLLYLLAAMWLFRTSDKADERKASRQMLFVGLCLGGAILFRTMAGIGLPAFIVGASLILRRRGLPRPRMRLWFSLLVGPSVAAIIALGYNYSRFESLFRTGYTEVAWGYPFVVGLYGLLFSAGKSVFLYNPLLIASPLGLWLRARAQPAWTLLTICLAGAYVASHASYNYWTGGWNWGPRFLLPVVPFLLLASGGLLQPIQVRGGRALVVTLALLGFLVTLPAILVDHSRYLVGLSEEIGSDFYTRSVFQPALSPLRHQWAVASDVLRRFASPETRSAMRSALAGTPAIWPSNASNVNLASDRLLWQAELQRLDAPDFWYSHLSLAGYLPRDIAVALAATLIGSALVLGVLAFALVRSDQCDGRRRGTK